MSQQPAITELLAGTARGDGASLQQLYAVLYPEIKRVARVRLAQSGPNGRVAGLDTTALVHEGFLRMADQQGLQGETRGQFFAYVGRVLRSVVIDHLRTETRDKRGGDAILVTLSAASDVAAVQSQAVDMIGLDQALERMRALDPGLYELIEMVGFAGLSIAEVAELRGLSTRSINRELLKARALLQELLGDPPNSTY
ncbi:MULTISPECIES: ECF-type sigma factor [Roseateles]|uniref:Sigma-70 family RNA polymerase sigma factor n=1 Tax=Pelomonas caseinilytica TaxID=2906763 RepID=A0ABS8XE08_9BURK|nr:MULTISPECIES: ECF-type sigma factor [unclassified Roseateles]MCE4539156.1 sigma-70 family RNA polymerase sigma factor [Pelomonas sp. P7]HEV6965358.1 ECF-type sigma factor [Roseateles sp.]